MTRFPNFDFLKEGRPARLARTMEAMAQLQRRQAAAYARWAEARKSAAEPGSTPADGPILDMVAPAAAGQAWTAPGQTDAPPSQSGPEPRGATPPIDIAALMRTLRENLPKTGLPGDLGENPGSPSRAPPVPDGARFEERTFSSAVGSRSYKIYVPSGYTGQPLPLVVMLHGCTQNPDDFAAGTGMNALAEERTFLVAYPGQPRSAHMQRCWNWYAASEQQREGGEPALIAGIARQVIEAFSADPSRVYAAGLSAGGAAAAILGATYPDLFSAIGVHSGLACGSARDLPSALAAMKGHGTLAPRGDRRLVPTIVFHGDGDRTVDAVNGDQVIAQAAASATLSRSVVEGRTPDGMAYTRTVSADASGRAVLEQWVLHGAGHAWSGGSPAGSFTDPRGPDASREMMRFFLAHANGPTSTRH